VDARTFPTFFNLERTMNDRHPNHPNNFDRTTGEIDDEAVLEGEVIEPMGTGVLATLHRVEIDQQIATAKAYPRNVPMIKKELTALVTMDEDTADECIYALPRGKKHIKGPSARFSDALISFWGNARSGAFITQVNREEKFVEAIGSFQDVERNVIRQRRVRRPIAMSDGRIYNADMINMTGNAACVIAERNAILNGIPKSLWGPAYEQAFALVAGTTKTLGEKLTRAEKAFALQGISMEQVLEKLDRADTSKIVPDDIVTMRGMLTALKTGEETVETIFGRGAGRSGHATVDNPLRDQPAEGNVQRQTAGSQNGTRTTPEQTEISGSVSSGKQDLSAEEKDRLAELDQKAAGAASKPAGADQPAEQKNAQAAASEPANAKPAAKAYTDGPSYLAYMRNLFATAKAKSVVTEGWSASRADRNELLTPDDIEAITEEKTVALERFRKAD
jgi:hypothetical protein